VFIWYLYSLSIYHFDGHRLFTDVQFEVMDRCAKCLVSSSTFQAAAQLFGLVFCVVILAVYRVQQRM